MTVFSTTRALRAPGILRSLLGLLAAASLALATAACGGGGGGPAPNPIVLTNFALSLSGFDPHVGQYSEFYVVSSIDDLWIAAIYDPLPAASLNISAPKSLKQGVSYRVDFWCDLSGDRSQDPFPTDHSWSEAAPGGILAFPHDTNWTNFSPGSYFKRPGDFNLSLTGFDSEIGKPFEARVIDTASGRTIGIYRLGEITSADFSIAIPDIINPSTYQVDMYVDENSSLSYDAAPADHSWRVTQGGSNAGLSVSFAHSETYTNIGL